MSIDTVPMFLKLNQTSIFIWSFNCEFWACYYMERRCIHILNLFPAFVVFLYLLKTEEKSSRKYNIGLRCVKKFHQRECNQSKCCILLDNIENLIILFQDHCWWFNPRACTAQSARSIHLQIRHQHTTINLLVHFKTTPINDYLNSDIWV